MLDLTQDSLEWKEIASMNYGRYRLALVASGSHIYAVGGDGAFSNRNDVEVMVFIFHYDTFLLVV